MVPNWDAMSIRGFRERTEQTYHPQNHSLPTRQCKSQYTGKKDKIRYTLTKYSCTKLSSIKSMKERQRTCFRCLLTRTCVITSTRCQMVRNNICDQNFLSLTYHILLLTTLRSGFLFIVTVLSLRHWCSGAQVSISQLAEQSLYTAGPYRPRCTIGPFRCS